MPVARGSATLVNFSFGFSGHFERFSSNSHAFLERIIRPQSYQSTSSDPDRSPTSRHSVLLVAATHRCYSSVQILLKQLFVRPFHPPLDFYLCLKREPALRWILGHWHSVRGRVHPAEFLSATGLTSADEVTTHAPPQKGDLLLSRFIVK